MPGADGGSRCSEVPSRGAGQGGPQGPGGEAGLAEMLPGDARSRAGLVQKGLGVFFLPFLPLFSLCSALNAAELQRP